MPNSEPKSDGVVTFREILLPETKHCLQASIHLLALTKNGKSATAPHQLSLNEFLWQASENNTYLFT